MHRLRGVAAGLGHAVLPLLQGDHVGADHHHRRVCPLLIILGRADELRHRLRG